jgi:hypothetical protein
MALDLAAVCGGWELLELFHTLAFIGRCANELCIVPADNALPLLRTSAPAAGLMTSQARIPARPWVEPTITRARRRRLSGQHRVIDTSRALIRRRPNAGSAHEVTYAVHAAGRVRDWTVPGHTDAAIW